MELLRQRRSGRGIHHRLTGGARNFCQRRRSEAESEGMDFPRICENTGEMRALGHELAQEMESGAVIGLDGDLGAGKTEFVKGFAAGMGYDGLVTSPTFTLLHEYAAGKRVLYHLDFYRVEGEQEILALGWDDLLEDSGGVVVVEWASKFAGLLPAGTLRLSLKLTPEGGRRIHRQDS